MSLGERLLVLGNGPSLKQEYFDLFHGTACLGMNAAYRYWDRIGWYPDYYCCLDDQVAVSHADSIRRLMEEGRCRKFLLHHHFFRAHPDLVGCDSALALIQLMPGENNAARCAAVGLVHQPSDLFRSTAPEKLTTGAYAVRFAGYLGFRTVGLIGVDCRYVEKLPETKEVDGIVLEIESTPERNPNYFFADYQAAGDRYNLPNPEAHGGNLHLQSFEVLKRDIGELGFDIDPYVCTEESELYDRGVFPCVPVERFVAGAFLSAVMMPLTAGEVDKVTRRFETWQHAGFRPCVDPAPAPRADLCLCFNGSPDAGIEARVSTAFEEARLGRFFKGLKFFYSNLAGMRDLYVPERRGRHGPDGYSAGPNNQFFDIVQAFSVGMARIMLMETDVVPLGDGWLTRIEEVAAEKERYWICGSQYRGRGNVESFFHVNGNAIYSVGDREFRRFFTEVYLSHYRKRVREQPGLSYDIVLHDFFGRLFAGQPDTVALQDWGNYAHRIRFSGFIVNVSHEYDRRPENLFTLQEARRAFPDSALFHGATGLIDDCIDRSLAVRTGSARLVYIDCDAVDEWGHFIAYANRIAAAVSAMGIETSVLANESIGRRIREASASSIEPTFSMNSEIRAGPQIRRFGAELNKALEKIRRRSPRQTLFLYMYTAGLEHLEQVLKIVGDDRRIFVNVNLFYAFAVRDDVPAVRHRWRAMLRECASDFRLTVTVPTEAVSRDFVTAFGVRLPVAPHPSTTFGDEEAADLAGAGPYTLPSDRPRILFPGGVAEAKGFPLAVEAARLLAQKGSVDCTVRAVVRPNTEEALESSIAQLAGTGARVVDRVLDEAAFKALLKDGDVFVLPYRPTPFARRTSGLVIDAVLLGRPFVAIEGTWLGAFATNTGAGLAVRAGAGSIVAGVDAILADYAGFSGRAAEARQKYLEANTWACLANTVIYGLSEYRDNGWTAGPADWQTGEPGPFDAPPAGGLADARDAIPAGDAHRVGEVANREAAAFRELFRSTLAESDPGSVATVIDELAEQLGALSARLNQVEQALAGGGLGHGRTYLAPAEHLGGQYADPESISRHFSLMIYLENIFRNRPGVLRALNGAHRFFSRLLKLP